MAERIQPDIAFIKELRAAGGDSLKACYQCATCSVACPISPHGNPFPRKEMIWAQWGLKDKLISDPDVWLCYNCGTCADLCPRGAKPADLMSALRNIAYQRLVSPSIIGKWMSSGKYLPVLIAIPALLFAIVWAIICTLNVGGYFDNSIFPSGAIEYGKLFYGDYTIDPIYTLVVIFVVCCFFNGTRRLIREIRPKGTVLLLGPKKSVLGCLMEVIFCEILPHKSFDDCGEDSGKNLRKIGHMSLVLGFIALFIVTGVIFAVHWGARIPGLEFLNALHMHTPLSFFHPIKILAQVGMLLLLVGLTILSIRRASLNTSKQTSSFYDWYLLAVLWAVAVTGMLSQFIRIADFKALAYSVYYLHLISVFMLFAYLPWSKLGHLVYRTAVLTFVRYKGR